jgi:hypothetical protein
LTSIGGQENIPVFLRNLRGLRHRSHDLDVIERFPQANGVSGVLNRGRAAIWGLTVDPTVLPRTGHQYEIAVSETDGLLCIPSIENILVARLGNSIQY